MQTRGIFKGFSRFTPVCVCVRSHHYSRLLIQGSVGLMILDISYFEWREFVDIMFRGAHKDNEIASYLDKVFDS